MTITTLVSRNEYTSTASQTVFNFTFKIYSATDLNVYVTPSGQVCDDSADLTTAYTVSPTTFPTPAAGGSITLTTPASAGDLVTIVSSIPESRTTDYQNNGDFLPDTVNGDFDRVVSLTKQIQDLANRTLVSGQCVQSAAQLTLPSPAAGLYLRWNTGETGVENAGVPVIITPNNNFSIVSDMVGSPSLVAGDVVQTLGYLATGDGGDNLYLARAVTGGTDDGGSLIKSTGNTAIEFIGIFPGSSHRFEQWGADSAGAIESSTECQAAIDYVAGLATDGSISWLGTILITTTLQMKFGVSLFGHGSTSSILNADGCDGLTLNFTTGFGNTVIRDIYIFGVNAVGQFGIINQTSLDDADELYGVTIENVLITDFSVGIHGRHFRNLTIDNCWIQDVQRGIELIGKNLVVYITKTKCTMANPPTPLSGDNTGIILDSFNFTAGTGIVPCEGVQINNCQLFGYEVGLDAIFCNFLNFNDNDLFATEIGISFTTIQLINNIKNNFIDMSTTTAAQGILGDGLASAINTVVNIEGNSINGQGSTTVLVGYQINKGGSQNQNHVNLIRNYAIGCDTNDIRIENGGITNIENNRCQSSAPTDSIRVTNVVVGPVFIDKNQCAGVITAVAAELTSGEVVQGYNTVSGTTVNFGTDNLPSIASATTVVLPFGSKTFQITGTTNITSITATGWKGQSVIFKFPGSGTVLVDASVNLRLAGNFTSTASGEDTMTLWCDGGNWFEQSRSLN